MSSLQQCPLSLILFDPQTENSFNKCLQRNANNPVLSPGTNNKNNHKHRTQKKIVEK